jgi:hypothetical protein
VSRAVVTHPWAAAATSQAPRTLLVLPTTCRASQLGASSCVPASYFQKGAAEEGFRVPKTFAELIDPLLRIKLQAVSRGCCSGRSVEDQRDWPVISARRVARRRG